MTLALPLRERILQKIAERLVITQGDTYFTTIPAVYRTVVNPTDSYDGPPIVYVIAPTDTVAQRDGRGSTAGCVERNMDVDINVLWRQETASDTAANLIARDIEAAMGSDRQFSTLALNSYPVGQEIVTLEGQEPWATIRIRWQIVYRVDFANPSTQR